MTDVLTIVLLCLALLMILFLAMPMAVVLYWMEETFPGLLENLKFWALVVAFTLLVLFIIVPPNSFKL